LIEFDAWFDLSWFEGELVICLGFRGVWSFAIEKPHVLVAALFSFELGIRHPCGLV
jgi:hypothetical protein